MVCEPIFLYRPQSEGDNALGSIRLCVRLCVCMFRGSALPRRVQQRAIRVITILRCLSVGCNQGAYAGNSADAVDRCFNLVGQWLRTLGTLLHNAAHMF